MAIGEKTMFVLHDSNTISNDEKIIDGGPAKSKKLKPILKQIITEHKGANWARLPGMYEADWVATESGLYYVAFEAGVAFPYPWEDIIRMNIDKHGRKFSKVALLVKTTTVDGNSSTMELDISLGSLAAGGLIGIYRTYGAEEL